MAIKKASPRRQEARKASRLRGEERVKLRIAKQKEAEKRNKELREQGLLTPWEQAKAARAERRKGKKRAPAIVSVPVNIEVTDKKGK